MLMQNEIVVGQISLLAFNEEFRHPLSYLVEPKPPSLPSRKSVDALSKKTFLVLKINPLHELSNLPNLVGLEKQAKCATFVVRDA